MQYEYALDPINPAAVAALERTLGFGLPADYREFLLRQNGGRPERHFYDGPFGTAVLNDLYGIDLRENPDILDARVGDLLQSHRHFADCMPHGFVVIGDSPGGDQVVLATAASGAHGVYYLDHENVSDDIDAPTLAQCPGIHRVADSFAAFLASLQPDRPD